MAGWLTLDEARDWWREAPDDDELLQLYLNNAANQVLAYGPQSTADAIAAGGEVPDNYRLAQLSQTRNVWNAVKSDPSTGGIGDEGFVFRPFPMDWTVKAIIRPQRAKPVVR
ncbi:head-tail connector protein [Microbacterium sp. P5_E9]